ncbi:MAG: hypothetical protein KGJ86_19820 [Chloroflexota bacterium]|nr:hypothetical protein [Chloroflexota bacterium]
MNRHNAVFFPTHIAAFGVLVAAALGIAVLVLTTDPTPRQEQLFTILVFVGVAALGTILALVLSSRGQSPGVDAARGVRRGILIGLASAGAVFLQLNDAFRITNVAFIALVLLIVEMVFLARRQHPS